jgi:electron transport complex protein RnfG
MKKILQLVVSLTIISAVCAAVLAFVNKCTKDRIANLTTEKTAAAAKAVLPSSVTALDKKSDPSDPSLEVVIGYADAAKTKVAGYAVPGLSKKGYGGEIRLMVGLTPDRKVVTYRPLAANETPGLGAKLGDQEFSKQFNDKNGTSLKVKKDGGEIDAITGATITSRAVCEAIADACARVDRIEGKAAANPAAEAVARAEADRKAVGKLQPLTEDIVRRVLPKPAATLKQVPGGEGSKFPSYVAKDASGATVGYAVVGTGKGAGPNGDIVLHILFGFTSAKMPAQRPQVNLNQPDVPMTDMEAAQRTAFAQALADANARLKAIAD